MEETVGPVSTWGRELLRGWWRPIGLVEKNRIGRVFSQAQHTIILYNYLIVVEDYFWATCFDWLLNHLQDTETQGYLQSDVTFVLDGNLWDIIGFTIIILDKIDGRHLNN
jgi:hypothetical protein